jgi:hypothetical protein
MNISQLHLVLAVFFVASGQTLLAGQDAPTSEGVQISKSDTTLRIEIGGKLFTEYHFKDVPKPYYYPLLGPGELAMTRKWPMENPPGEEQDHKHHRSLWYGHEKVNGVNFWEEGRKAGKIVHTGFQEITSGPQVGVIKSTDNWVAPDGTVVCTDERTFRVYNRPDDQRLFDFEITIHAMPDRDLVFGDDKDGAMALRVAETMRLKGTNNQPGQGHIVLSTGLRDDETWGKRADWCDYYGPVDGKTVGIAMFDHPSNPRHPTWWHVRYYGLFAANPFGLHFFENKPEGAGDLTVPAGKSLTFRYRFYIHQGDEKEAQVAREYSEYSTMK